MLRRHTAYNSSVHELAGVCGLLRGVTAGAPGQGPVHLLLSSAASLGLSWDSDLCVWLRPGLPALCQISSPFQFFRKAVWDAWRTCTYLDFRSSLKLLSSLLLRGGDKGLLRGILSGVFGMDFFSALSVEKSFLVVSVGVLIVMGICFGNVLILLLFIFEKVLSFMTSCFWIGVPGLGVFSGMVGCLPLLVLVGLLLGLLRMMVLLTRAWWECWVPTLKVSVGNGFPLIVFLLTDLAASDVSEQPDVWADGSFCS